VRRVQGWSNNCYSTDPQANNYNPEANINDGSCTYDPTLYSPDFNYLLSNDLEETSGLIYYNEGLWTINDSGNDAALYKLDTTTGVIFLEVSINDAVNVDWESLAQDEEHIYIGDFGNNSGNRTDLGIYIVSKNDLPESGYGSVSSNHITFTYPDYPGRINKRGENNFDCEAMIAIGDSLYLFSKNWEDQKTKLYRFPKDAGDYEAELLTTFNTDGLVTGADYNIESGEVTLIGYSASTTVPFLWLLFDYHDHLLFSGNKRRIDLTSIIAAQTEAIAYTQGKHGKISAEGNALYTQSVFGYFTGTWTDQSTTGIVVHQADDFDFTLSPNPVQKGKLNVNISSLPIGDFEVKLYDTSGTLMQIKDYTVGTKKGEIKIKLKVGHLNPGLYFVRMRSGNVIVEKKFIKQ